MISRWSSTSGSELLSACFLVLCRVAEMGELLDVVHEAEELPLSVDLHSPAQREAIESLVVSQIPEDWLYGREALAVARSTLWGVEAPLHPIGVALSCIAGSAMEEGHLTHHDLLRRLAMHGVQTGLRKEIEELKEGIVALEAIPRNERKVADLERAFAPALSIVNSRRLLLCMHDGRTWIATALAAVKSRFRLPPELERRISALAQDRTADGRGL